MPKELPQVMFDFSVPEERPTEFLSGRLLQPPPPPKPKSTRGRKPLKNAELLDDVVQIPEDEVLFQKAYYGISEVAEMFKVTVSQVRYWDNEFDILAPRKNRKGDRFFRPVDIKNLQLIHDLVRRRKFTVEGAKDYLKKNSKAREAHELIASLQKLRTFLLELKANL